MYGSLRVSVKVIAFVYGEQTNRPTFFSLHFSSPLIVNKCEVPIQMHLMRHSCSQGDITLKGWGQYRPLTDPCESRGVTSTAAPCVQPAPAIPAVTTLCCDTALLSRLPLIVHVS